jgi:hypothetical protein
VYIRPSKFFSLRRRRGICVTKLRNTLDSPSMDVIRGSEKGSESIFEVALQCFYVCGVCSSLLVLGGSGSVKCYEWCGADEMRDEILGLVGVVLVGYVEPATRSVGWFGSGAVGCEGEM